MNEWKRLYREDLPSDILVGDYEFEWSDNGTWKGKKEKTDLIHDVLHSVLYGYTYRYRIKETPPPTHEEIMTKWWEVCTFKDVWIKVFIYEPDEKECYGLLLNILNGSDKSKESITYRSWVPKEWFTGKKSADIPPEKEQS